MEAVYKINNVDYVCEFTLSNPDNQKVSFTKSAIRGMTLIDNVFDPFYGGTITLANPYDFVEHDCLIRGDGRDELVIKFKPKEDTGFKNDFFEHTFILINDFDSVNPLSRAENFRTFSLVAKDSIPFTDKLPYVKTYSGKVGRLLRDVFEELLGKDKVDSKNWEDGDFEITYTPPATFRYMDVIRYFARMFYAKDGDLHVKGFIGYDCVNKKYQFKLLTKIFQENNDIVMESFGIGDLTSEIGFENPNNPPQGSVFGEYIGQMRNLGYSTPLYSWTTDYFVPALVFGYDPVLGQQKICKLDFESVKKRWKTKFVDPFTSRGGKPKPFTIQNNTTEKCFKRYKFPYPVEDGVKIVEAEMHNALTFYNLQLSFGNVGRCGRASGEFIDVFSPRKLTGDEKSPKSHEKLLGRWFVTEVRHVFFADLYTNDIFCLKTYLGPNSNVNEKVE